MEKCIEGVKRMTENKNHFRFQDGKPIGATVYDKERTEETVAYGDKYKCFVEVDVIADSQLEAIQKVEMALDDYRIKHTFDIKRCSACKEYLDITYGDMVEE